MNAKYWPCVAVKRGSVAGVFRQRFDSFVPSNRKEARMNVGYRVELSHYLVFSPPETSLAELAAVAGLRCAVEECFERAKNDLGLDHCEARSWHGWHRHMSLCMAALAFLSKLSADLRRSAWIKPKETSPDSTTAA